jgi:hypothetical protein
VPIFRLVNETYKDLLGFVPLSEAEMQKIAKSYLPILDPDFVKIIVDENNEPIAFVVGLPDMSKGLKKLVADYFLLDLFTSFWMPVKISNWICC